MVLTMEQVIEWVTENIWNPLVAMLSDAYDWTNELFHKVWEEIAILKQFIDKLKDIDLLSFIDDVPKWLADLRTRIDNLYGYIETRIEDIGKDIKDLGYKLKSTIGDLDNLRAKFDSWDLLKDNWFTQALGKAKDRIVGWIQEELTNIGEKVVIWILDNGQRLWDRFQDQIEDLISYILFGPDEEESHG